MRLQDKVAIVTGAAKGIGKTLAGALVSEGAKVVLADVEDAEATAKEISSGDGTALAVRCDVTSDEEARACAKAAVDEFGRIDVLVNNAAIYGGLRPNPFESIPDDEWDKVMAVNVNGVLKMTRAAVEHMKAANYGRIVNMSSGVFLSGSPYFLQYVTSKGAVVGMTRGMARELGDWGITVNAITPGVIWTGATEDVVGGMGMDKDTFLETVLPTMSVKRPQKPEDLVGTVLYLASDDASMTTGQIVNVDGGINFH